MDDGSRCDATGPSPAGGPRTGSGVFAGVRVLDMARVLAGPWAAQLLADFGAEVIKLERPGGGDDSRAWEPSFESGRVPGMRVAGYFCAANRGKRSVTVDFAKPEGARLVRELAAASAVLIENYKTGTLARYGLGPEQLLEVNPRLVYCSVTGFGQTGPYRERSGYDSIIQAIGGMMSITGERDGMPGAGPQRAGVPVIDIMTGVYAAFAVVAALRERDRSGRGQVVDLSLLDVQVSALSYFGMNYLASGRVPVRMGNSNPVTFPSGNFDASDRPIVLLVGNDAQFARFSEALGRPELAADERFVTSPQRVRHAAALTAIIAPVIAGRPAEHWMAELEARGVPCGSINDLKAVFDDPQVRARGNVERARHPVFGEIPILANPVRMSRTPASYEVPPPLLGEHTAEVLATVLGLGERELAALRDKGVV